jgi:small-conductance mechanosensitive channel
VPDEAGNEHLEPELGESTDQEVPRSWLNSVLAFLAGLIFLALLVYFGIAQGMAALAMFPGIPLVLLWFVYWFFLRRLIRIRRIRGIRERRLINEAAQRGRHR